MTKTKVAVYGTLRRGFGNHGLLEGSQMIGEGNTVDGFTMRARGIPYVSKNGQTQIKVEVYSVDEVTLDDLDSLEGHPRWYKREEVDVKLDNGKYERAYMYLMDEESVSNVGIVESGDYKNYVYGEA
jgi:gamma-glutamylcyclotransferase (GGCT)/AIG2-like uncharacterized protein YtfP